MKERLGSVWYRDRNVGRLRSDRRGVLFLRYHADWVEAGFPVSVRLPLRVEETCAHGFFQGLLPEGRSRLRICRQLRIDSDDDAGLLFAIGEDCAGALSVVPGDGPPSSAAEQPRPITVGEMRTIVRSKGAATAEVFDRPHRFSLAGAQEKLPVIESETGYLAPNTHNPSTHILKFETHTFVCACEHMTLALARSAGLSTVESEYRTVESDDGEVPYLKIVRYDRRRQADGTIARVHQEDLIQALGYETDFKYQGDGGPDLRDVTRLLRDVAAIPLEAIRTVVDWQIFNYLVGNSDAHGKNISLLYHIGGAPPEIAPLYDLLAIGFLNKAGRANYDRNLAFAIGGVYVPEKVNKDAWSRFASDVGVRESLVTRRLVELAEMLPSAAASVRASFAERFGDHPVYAHYEKEIVQRCRWALRVFGIN